MNVAHNIPERPSTSPKGRAPTDRLIESMLGVSGDNDVIHRVLCELEQLVGMLSDSLNDETHRHASIAHMAHSRARTVIELYERRGLLCGGVDALDQTDMRSRTTTEAARAETDAERVAAGIYDGTEYAREAAEALFMTAQRLARLVPHESGNVWRNTECCKLVERANAKYATLVTQLGDIDEMAGELQGAGANDSADTDAAAEE